MNTTGSRFTVMLLAVFLGLATSLLVAFFGHSYGMRGALVVILICVVFAYLFGKLSSRFNPQIPGCLLAFIPAGIPSLFAARGLLLDDKGTPAWAMAAVAIFISIYLGIRVHGGKNSY